MKNTDELAESVDGIANAIRQTLISPNVMDSNFEDANIVDVLSDVANGLCRIAKAIEKHAEATAKANEENWP